MAQIAKWNGHVFEVSSKVVRSFTGLTIKGAGDIRDDCASDATKEIYYRWVKQKPLEMNLTAHLNARLGCSVQKEAMAFIDEAKKGKKNYFYVAGKKLVAYNMMLADASVSEIHLNPKGVWIQADVQLHLVQAGFTNEENVQKVAQPTKSKADPVPLVTVDEAAKSTTTDKTSTKSTSSTKSTTTKKTETAKKEVATVTKVTNTAKEASQNKAVYPSPLAAAQSKVIGLFTSAGKAK